MTRISKKTRRKNSPRKHKNPSVKSGPKKDNLPLGYKAHANALEGMNTIFIAKVK